MADIDFYYPFDSIDGDRKTTAATERRFFGALFTDGVVGAEAFQAEQVDAGVYNIGAGVAQPAEISVYVSDDGKTRNFVVSEKPDAVTDKGVASTDFVLETGVKARYVQFRYVHSEAKPFAMISEAEVYGFAIEQEDTFLRGDVNMDGKITAKDYMMLKRVLLGTRSEEHTSELQSR